MSSKSIDDQILELLEQARPNEARRAYRRGVIDQATATIRTILRQRGVA